MNTILANLTLAGLSLVITSCVAVPPKDEARISSAPVQIVFDTDFGGDADDLGAIAMLHHYADEGVINLEAIVSWSREEYAMPALIAVNTYYGRPELTVGVREVEPWRTEWNHTKIIADQFSHAPELVEQVIPAVTLYRQILVDAEPHSITLVTVGPLANVRNLLASTADEISPLSGADLFDQKIKQVVIMGGQFPAGITQHGPEWNFDGNMPGVTEYVLDNVTRPIVFSGYEVGEALKVGRELNAHPKSTPLYVGYKYFSEHAPWINADYDGAILDNSSFDQTAVMYAAIGGVGTYWELSDPGTLTADAQGVGTWTPDPNGLHRYLILSGDTKATETYIANAMTHDAD